MQSFQNNKGLGNNGFFCKIKVREEETQGKCVDEEKNTLAWVDLMQIKSCRVPAFYCSETRKKNKGK